MRIFPHALLGLLVAAFGCSAEDKPVPPEKKADKPKLGLGDPAPAITDAVWHGKEPKIEKGQVYVFEFWATWCGPCIKSMPHLTTLLEEYKGKGLNVVAVTTKDDNGNTQEAVRDFLKKRGGRFPFPFAFCTTDATNDAFMEASGTNGIPASFVVDRAGKVAFIGHPTELDDVLPRVLDGTWQGQKSIDEIQKEKDDLDAILNKVQSAAEAAEKANQGKGPAVVTKAVADAAAAAAGEVLTALPDYEKKYPIRAKQPVFTAVKLAVTLQARKFDDAAKLTDGLLKQGVEKKDAATLGRIRSFWLAKALNPERKSAAYAVTAAEEVLKIEGDGDIAVLLNAAEAYYATGDKAKGKEYGDKALAVAEKEKKSKEPIEKALKEYQK